MLAPVTALVIGVLTSAVGLAYIAYGRRQTRFMPIIAGVALCAYSYFIDGWIWLVLVGALLAAAPFVFDF